MSFIYEIHCAQCNEPLDISKSRIDLDHDISIEVEPCDFCKETAKSQGYNECKEEHDITDD